MTDKAEVHHVPFADSKRCYYCGTGLDKIMQIVLVVCNGRGNAYPMCYECSKPVKLSSRYVDKQK